MRTVLDILLLAVAELVLWADEDAQINVGCRT